MTDSFIIEELAPEAPNSGRCCRCCRAESYEDLQEEG